MLPEQYNLLIGALLVATKAERLKWKTSPSNRHQFTLTPTNEQRILIDRYYALENGAQLPCVNMTIFSNPEEHIIDEIVICESALPEEEASFRLLKELYEVVLAQADRDKKEKIKPILAHITESVSRAM